MEKQPGLALAHHLGRALQLTNILRDLDEDAAIGRLYLPREALATPASQPMTPRRCWPVRRSAQACATVAARAERHFAEAEAIMARSPRRAVRAPRIMGAAYKAILNALVARGWAAPRAPVKVSKPRLLLTILRYAFI